MFEKRGENLLEAARLVGSAFEPAGNRAWCEVILTLQIIQSFFKRSSVLLRSFYVRQIHRLIRIKDIGVQKVEERLISKFTSIKHFLKTF